MPTVQISKTHGPGEPSVASSTPNDQSWYSITITTNPDNGLLVSLPSNIPNQQLQEIRWYLEDHAQQDPLATGRASVANCYLMEYGKALISSIDWDHLIRPYQRQEPLILEIKDSSDEALWEVLEDIVLWGEYAPPTVQIYRTHTPCTTNSASPVDTEDTQRSESINILVVAARPDSDKDVPHRMVSRILHDTIKEAKGKAGSPNATISVVRPGTWDAFCSHLNSSPHGYYDIVHFDLHGMEDSDGQTHLAFIKADTEDPATFQPKLIKASRVAAVLTDNGVYQVVLNACRSARGFGMEQCAASAMMSAGTKVCIAMTHRIVSRAVEIYAAVLYDALIVQNISLHEAAIIARTALRNNKNRVSGYGDTIAVNDWVVPIVYTAFHPHPEARLIQDSPESSEMNFNAPLYGREGDILRLESALLIAKKAVLITGPSGIGKTYLLEHLQPWWRSTGLTSKTHYIQFSQRPIWNLDGMFRYFHGMFFLGQPFPGREAIIQSLRNTRCLLILDSLESVDLSDRDKKRAFHRELPRLLRSLQGGRTMVVLASRCSESWLSRDTITHRLGGLGTIGGLQLLRQSLADLDYDESFAEGGPGEAARAFEQIVKLVDGNSVAIVLIAAAFFQTNTSPHTFLLHLLAGGGIAEFNMDYFEEREGFRGLVQLNEIISSLDPSGFDAFLPVQILAPFWKILPSNDALTYALCYCRKLGTQVPDLVPSAGKPQQKAREMLSLMKLMGQVAGWEVPTAAADYGGNNASALFSLLESVADIPADETSDKPLLPEYLPLDDVILSVEGVDLDAISVPFSGMEKNVSRILEPLEETHFLSAPEGTTMTSRQVSKGCLSINPCLTILLRSHVVYRENMFNIADAARRAFSYYYAYRTKRFPFTHIYYNPTWAGYREELEFEFTNFLAASAVAFQPKREVEGTRLEQSIMSRMLGVIHRGIGVDPGRLSVVQLLWSTAITCNLRYESSLISRRPSTITSFLGKIWQMLPSLSAEETPKGSLYTDGTDEGAYREVLLFALRSNTLQLALQCATAFQHLNSNRVRHFQELAERLIGDMIHDGIPEGQDQVYWKKMLDYYLYLAKMGMGSNVGLDELWTKREEWVKLITDHHGVEAVPSNPTSWESLPMDLLAKHSHSARIITQVLHIRQAMKEGRLEDARKCIDAALRSEIFEANDDLANRASLLELLSEVNEKSGEWGDALKYFDEANELADKVAAQHDGIVRLDFKQRFKREFRRQTLLQGIRDSAA